MQDQKVLWTRGFGYADLENRVPATPDTLYQGQLAPDEPIAPYTPSKWAPAITDQHVQVRHILSHTRPRGRRVTVRSR